MKALPLFHWGKFEYVGKPCWRKGAWEIPGTWTLYDSRVLGWLPRSERACFTFEDGAVPKWKTLAVLRIYKLVVPGRGVCAVEEEMEEKWLDPDYIFDYAILPWPLAQKELWK